MSDETILRGGTELRSGAEVIANRASRGLVPGFGGRVSAALVWDGGETVNVPEAMGKPREDQMRGTVRERLVELSGRLCYDALGRGRSTEDYFKHILDVNHTSIVEHAAFTVELTFERKSDCVEAAVYLLNRPGVWVDWEPFEADPRLRVTLNPRVVLDWEKHYRVGLLDRHPKSIALGSVLNDLASDLVPNLVCSAVDPDIDEEYARVLGLEAAHVDEPECDEEKWISIYLVGSRGWGNELVRHRMGAISQRSTRYVEESESEWVLHPLLDAHGLDENDVSMSDGLAVNVRTALSSIAGKLAQHVNHGAADRPGGISLSEILREVRDYADFWRGFPAVGMVAQEARIAYNAVATRLTCWLKSKGVDATSARKQARGAARGLLGLGLETEIIYSASVKTWHHILSMRAADAADAEIRLGFAEAVLPCLKASRYGDRFADLELVPASDGIGRSIRGGGHR